MKKQFRSKRRLKKSLFLWIILIVFTLIIDHNIFNNISKSFIIDNSKKINKINIDKEKLLLFLGLNYHKSNNKDVMTFNEVELPKPKIYLYSTHQTEEYVDGNILEASLFLKEELERNEIEVIRMDESIPDIIKEKKLKYKDSYKISREFMEMNMSDEIALYIDLHRDSSSKKVTTTTIDEKNYAKVMFVVGGKHDTYKENYKVADNLNKLFKNYNKNITRGIYVRKSSSYNQDLTNNSVLIELGGPENKMEEVKNTIGIIADILLYYIGE